VFDVVRFLSMYKEDRCFCFLVRLRRLTINNKKKELKREKSLVMSRSSTIEFLIRMDKRNRKIYSKICERLLAVVVVVVVVVEEQPIAD
jgi:uncharacterized protein with PIN domain